MQMLHCSFYSCLSACKGKRIVFGVKLSTGPEDSIRHRDTGNHAEGPTHVSTLEGMLEDARDRAAGPGEPVTCLIRSV